MEPDVMFECEVERLKPHPNNPRRGDVNAIAASLERFGQVKPIIVQRATGYIVAGNHTYQAACKLGWAKVQVLVKDMTDEEARSYLIADNRTSDKGSYDEANLYELLSQTLDLSGTGYDLDDVETLADALGGNAFDEDTGEAIRTQAGPGDSSRGIHPEAVQEGTVQRMRDIVLLMTAEDAVEFGQQVARLQGVYGTRTVVDTVRRAVADALVAVPAPAAAAPAPQAAGGF